MYISNVVYSLSLFQCLLRPDGWFAIHIIPTSFATLLIYFAVNTFDESALVSNAPHCIQSPFVSVLA